MAPTFTSVIKKNALLNLSQHRRAATEPIWALPLSTSDDIKKPKQKNQQEEEPCSRVPRSPFRKVAFALSPSQVAAELKLNNGEDKDTKSVPIRCSRCTASKGKELRGRRAKSTSPHLRDDHDHDNNDQDHDHEHEHEREHDQHTSTSNLYSNPFEQVALNLPPVSRGPLVPIPRKSFDDSDPSVAQRLPTITFQSKKRHAELGLKVGEVLVDPLSCAPADLIGVMDTVFPAQAKIANIHISWPGCPRTFSRRLDTQEGTVTRGFLLMSIARAIMEFSGSLQSRDIATIPGLEKCQFGDSGIRGKDVVITSLLHRGGMDWEPTLFARPSSS